MHRERSWNRNVQLLSKQSLAYTSAPCSLRHLAFQRKDTELQPEGKHHSYHRFVARKLRQRALSGILPFQVVIFTVSGVVEQQTLSRLTSDKLT